MFASQITTVSQASYLTIQTSTASLGVRGLSRRPRQQSQQSRSFRFGIWSSYLDHIAQKELRHRHRLIKHKYVEALNRKLSWDRQIPLHKPHWTLKSFMYSAWRGHDSRPGGRWVNVDELKNTTKDDAKLRNKSVDELEQRALDSVGRVFGRHNARIIQDFIKQSRGSLERGWNTETGSSYSTTSPPSEPLNSGSTDVQGVSSALDASQEVEYDIDPISNRKVFRNSKSKTDAVSPESSANTFKGYRSQFSKFEPRNSKDLKEELKGYKPVMYNEPDGQLPSRPDLVKEALMDYDSTQTYDSPIMYDEPHGKLPEEQNGVAEALSDYDQHHAYHESVALNEHLGSKTPDKHDMVKEGLEFYDSQQSYDGPVMFNEHLDGQLPNKPDLVVEGLEDYDQYQSYDKPATFNEHLDGQLPLKPDLVAEALKDHDQHCSYNGPAMLNDNSDRQLHKQADHVGQGLNDYDRNHEYQPFFYNHPDGHGAQQQEEPLFQDHGNDSGQSTRRRPAWVLDADRRDDVDLLRASDVRASSGIIKGVKKETDIDRQSRRRKLEQDFNSPEKLSSDEILAAKKVKDTRKLNQELENERSELLNLNAHARGRVNAKIAELEAEASSGAANTSAGKTLTGNFVRDFPEEFKATWTKDGTSYITESESALKSAENDYAAQISQEWKPLVSKSKRLETSMDRKYKEEAEIDPYSKTPRGLEKCYAEEVLSSGGSKPLFSTSYGCGAEKDAKTQKAKNEERKRQKELVREIRSIYEDTYGIIDCQHRQVSEDGAIKAASSNVPKPKTAKVAQDTPNLEPTVYKILAYDPTMQEINMAETTSIVHDGSSALTPAEVLLRLSQPAKFFPHFKPLQAQGYEIVSGSGDVLVFRKVRDGLPPAKSIPKQDSSRISNHTHRGRPINPVDGMKYVPQPAAANFASPTGFVGEPVRIDDDLEEPRFKSNIDVRREEAVFSGRGTGWQDGDRKPRRTGKKLLIGAAWVAACSYAVGVVAEFFKTGGSDGQGPVGF